MLEDDKGLTLVIEFFFPVVRDTIRPIQSHQPAIRELELLTRISDSSSGLGEIVTESSQEELHNSLHLSVILDGNIVRWDERSRDQYLCESVSPLGWIGFQ
jgi:hypothetical protein